MSTTATAGEQLAQQEISTAWQSHKQNGLAFGRTCHEWGEKFKAQGSHNGSAFQNVLNSLEIPRHIADFWAMKYKASIGEGIRCPSCSSTFPSPTQLKRHQNKTHPEIFHRKPATPAPPAVEVPKIKSETTEPAAITDTVSTTASIQPKPSVGINDNNVDDTRCLSKVQDGLQQTLEKIQGLKARSDAESATVLKDYALALTAFEDLIRKCRQELA